MKYLFLSVFVFLELLCVARSKQDYYWIWNNNSYRDSLQAYLYDFEDTVKRDPFPLGVKCPIELSGLNASICNQDGNLLMYSNGCTVVDQNHQVMPNGRNLNNNDYFQLLGDSCFGGYLGKQDIMILPDPGYEYGYYILHKPVIPGEERRYRELRYSYVDISLNNGNGEVTSKNIVLSDSLKLNYSYLTAINHENGKDWWILQTFGITMII